MDNNIRFFYSSKEELIALKAKKNAELDNNCLDVDLSIIQLEFCMGTPLHSMQNHVYNYTNRILNKYIRESKPDLDLFNVLDSVFYLIATGYPIQLDNAILDLIKEVVNLYRIKDDDDFTSYSLAYLFIISHLNEELNIANYTRYCLNNIIKNKSDYFEEFDALKYKKIDFLYLLVEQELQNVNRMKNYYLRFDVIKNRTVGYQDFTSILSLVGKLCLWTKIGVLLEYNSLNRIFVHVLEHDICFFKLQLKL